jgi:hypothetical protein
MAVTTGVTGNLPEEASSASGGPEPKPPAVAAQGSPSVGKAASQAKPVTSAPADAQASPEATLREVSNSIMGPAAAVQGPAKVQAVVFPKPAADSAPAQPALPAGAGKLGEDNLPNVAGGARVTTVAGKVDLRVAKRS